MLKEKFIAPPLPAEEPAPTPESVDENALAEMYQAVKRALLTVREDEDDPLSPPFFKTITLDCGQFARIIQRNNYEAEVAFPAIFVHYTNVRYLVQQQRIGQGRANMRVRFILNRLNNTDPDHECDPFYVFQRVNKAIQDAKDHEPALSERCQLTYFDMPTTSNMLQAYWIDYEVWFRETSGWRYRNWVERYLVMPPFTNHDDAPKHDEQGHGNHSTPTDREVITIEPSVEGSGSDDEEDELLS